MDTYTHSLLVRDAFCLKLSKTEEGREYLDKCHRYTLTEPDIKQLREQFAK